MSNPFVDHLTGLWAGLESRTGFTNLVKPGNRIKFHESPKRKDQLRAADTPEVRIVPGAVSPHLFRTSNGSSVRRTYRVEISTNDVNASKALEVEWEILKAFAAMRDALTSYSHVKQVRPVTGEAPGADPSERSDGWHTVLAVEVESWFETAAMAQDG